MADSTYLNPRKQHPEESRDSRLPACVTSLTLGWTHSTGPPT